MLLTSSLASSTSFHSHHIYSIYLAVVVILNIFITAQSFNLHSGYGGSNIYLSTWTSAAAARITLSAYKPLLPFSIAAPNPPQRTPLLPITTLPPPTSASLHAAYQQHILATRAHALMATLPALTFFSNSSFSQNLFLNNNMNKSTFYRFTMHQDDQFLLVALNSAKGEPKAELYVYQVESLLSANGYSFATFPPTNNGYSSILFRTTPTYVGSTKLPGLNGGASRITLTFSANQFPSCYAPEFQAKSIPAVMPASRRCQFILEVRSTIATPSLVEMSGLIGNVIPLSTAIKSTIPKGGSEYWAVRASKSHFPLQIKLEPDRQNTGTDVDIFVFLPQFPFYYVHPSLQARNHAYNYPESATIAGNEPFLASFKTGTQLIIVQAFASSADTASEKNLYSIQFIGEADSSSSHVLGVSLFAIIGAMTVFVLCLFVTIGYIIRRRRIQNRLSVEMEINGIPALLPAPHELVLLRNSAPVTTSPQLISSFPVSLYQPEMMASEDAQCAICLSVYETRDSLRTLPCSHHFHQPCIDQWLLKSSKLCPLCQQNVEHAVNSRAQKQSGLFPNMESVVFPGQSEASDDVVLHMTPSPSRNIVILPPISHQPNPVVQQPINVSQQPILMARPIHMAQSNLPAASSSYVCAPSSVHQPNNASSSLTTSQHVPLPSVFVPSVPSHMTTFHDPTSVNSNS